MDKNEPITEHGLFWLRDHEQRKLWGTLYVNEVNESTLETFGSLIDPSDDGSHTIVGQIRAGQELVTLIDCFPTSTRNWGLSGDSEPDWSLQTCLVNRVVTGIGFEKGEEIAFAQATLDISTLPQWANPNLVKRDPAEDKTRPIRRTISIEDRVDETTRVSFGGEEINISIVFRPKEKWERRGVITRYLVEDHCYLILESPDGSKMPLKSILSVSGALLDLLSICCNETPTVTNFSVRLEKAEPRPAKVYVPRKGHDAKGKKRLSYAALGLKDLGGMAGVAQWIELKQRYGEPVALLTSNWYNEKAYNEDKLSRMYTAVEGLLSRKNNRKRANMKAAELAKFVGEAIPDFSSITKRAPEEWAEKVKEIRDQKISHSDPISTLVTDGRTMHVMTNVLYIAGASFLLREIGMGEKQIKGYIQKCSQSLLLSEQ